MRLCNFTNKDIFSSNFKLISLLTAVSVTMLFSLVDQTGWAAVIECPHGVAICNGTDEDDLITGTTDDAVIHGLGGNDYIIGWALNNFIYGDDGNDTLIGGNYHDGLYGGNGSDSYDGRDGHDTIYEDYHNEGSFVNNDDIISGGIGHDFIFSGEGSDKINGGPGSDFIKPSPDWRDFSPDVINCGSSGSAPDAVNSFYSGDGDTAALNCELIQTQDK